MGQKLSRHIVPKLKNATKSYESEVTKDAMSDIARRQAIAKAKGQKYIDPSAQSGFRRDTWGDGEGLSSPKEVTQQQFLKKAHEGSFEEMPKDLVDFLNKAGPLEREVSQEMTSEKVYDSLLEEEEQRRQQQQDARQRKRRRMPIIENTEDQSSSSFTDNDGMTVERTTNFSTAVKEEKENEIRLSDEELYDLLMKVQKNEITVPDYLSQKFGKDYNTSNNNDDNDTETEDGNEGLKLLEHVQKYNEIPTLMQDADKSLIGAPQSNIETLKLGNIRMAPNLVQLTLLSNMNSIQDEEMKNKQLKKAVVVK